ncbi:MAG: ribbon-helix-helix domain-containing protein [Desulfovibrionales bacterium]|nr:ribbon-helix-helix domain-containing protein [Desulfovibrionales bacterium]
MWITIAMVIHIQGGPIVTMRTVQMTLDDDLVEAVDRAAKRLHTSRSAFTRDALRDALTRYSVASLEQKHRRGYKAQPVKKGEFSLWEDEQAWGGE